MISKDELLSVLPPFKDQWVLVDERQDTSDIRRALMTAHAKWAGDYDLIYHFFDTGNIVDTSRQIFDFLKQQVPYTKENAQYQTCKSPTAILTDGETVDCKCYSLFIAGVLDAIQRNEGSNWDWTYRFASYDANDPEPGHVFVAVKKDGKELWIDPVFTYFNGGKMHFWELDEKPKSKSIAGLYMVSGAPVPAAQSGTVVVDAEQAAVNFLVSVNLNLFSLKDLLNSDQNILFGPVRQVCLQNGISFDSLLNLLQYE